MATYVSAGTVFARGDGASPEAFTTISQVRQIGTVGQQRGLIDVTNLASTARQYKKAMKDGQEIQLVIQYDPDDAGHANLRTDKDAETPRNYKITLTDASPPQTITFAGMVINWSITNIDVDQVLMLSVGIKPTGDLTFA